MQVDIKTYKPDQNFINSFKETVFLVFNEHDPMKTNISEQMTLFMTKGLYKEIIKQSRLKNKFLKSNI